MEKKLPSLNTCTIAVIGLGYVGLPLSVEFAISKSCLRTNLLLHRSVIGFDINPIRLQELRSGYDCTNEVSHFDLQASKRLKLTSDSSDLYKADVFIVTVPTPVDLSNRPDLTPLEGACQIVGRSLRARSKAGVNSCPVVIFESTVYPGATEEFCVPMIEKESGLHYNLDFVCGYSPERINPGDAEHRLTNIIKVTSGSTPDTAIWVDNLYGSIISAGTHSTSSIRVAEAAKVIENTQRDLNIALVNEFAILFSKLKIDTLDVLDAAASKWNFLNFRPGLVGGHCIGVDPYYLTYKSELVGYHPQLILAGRRINDSMGTWIVDKIVLELVRRGLVIAEAPFLILGFTFKQNCPDIRNTRVIDLVESLRQYGVEPEIVDPWADPDEALREYGVKVLRQIPADRSWLGIVAAVQHTEFSLLTPQTWTGILAPKGIIFDLKGIVPRDLEPLRL